MRFLITALALAIASPALAASKSGVTLADEVQVAGRRLVLNGLGVREATMFNVKVYVAGLYLEAKSTDPAEILSGDKAWEIQMKFKRDVEREKLTDAWEEGFEKNGNGALKGQVAKLSALMQDLKEGETMIFAYAPGVGTRVDVAGAEKGTIPGADFGRALLAVWLGPNPPNDGLKSGLLGK